MRQPTFCGGLLILLTASTLLGAVAGNVPPAAPPDYANGVTLEFDVAAAPGGPAAGETLTQDVVKQLQRRLDPDQTGKVIVRATGPTRAEAWMEYPRTCQELWRDMEKAAADFGPTTSPKDDADSDVVSKQQLEHLLRWGTPKQYGDFLAANPDKKEAIQRYADARNKLLQARGDAIPDPEEFASLALAPGDVAFRICVAPADLDAAGEIGKDAAIHSLKNDGPNHEIKVTGMNARWYPTAVDAEDLLSGDRFVLSGTGPIYMLCYDDPAASMTHDRGAAWEISSGKSFADPRSGTILVPIHNTIAP